MAYIKKTAEDEQQQSTMNTLGGGGQQTMSQPSSEAQNQPVNISGQQSSTIGQTSQQPSNQPKKGVGSGQYTDVKKYIQANRGATQRLGQAATQDFQKKAQSVGQAVQQKEQQLSDIINQNRQSIEQAKQFGQQTLQSANTQVDRDELQKQQEDYQKRISQLQNTQDQTQQIGQFQTDLDARRQALQGVQGQYEQDKATLAQQNQQFENLQQQKDIANLGFSQFTEDQQAQYDQLQQDILSGRDLVAGQYNQLLNEQKTLGETQNQLATAQDQQNLFARRQALENELAGLQQKMTEAPEAITDEDVSRYRALAEGKERYDQVAYDQAREQFQADQLANMAQGVEREDVRRQLLQQAFGKQGDYTRGEVALDDVLLKGSPEAAQALVSGVQGSSQSLQEQLRNARRSSLQGIAGLRQGQQELQTQLGEGATTAIQGLESEIDRRVASGEGTRLDAIRNALSEGVISADQAQLLGIEQGRTYGVDLGQELSDLSGLATRGSVSSRSDLARAQALSRLAGMTEQSVFANPDTVGQMSEAEKSRLAELQGELARGRRDYEQQASDAAYNTAIASGGSGDERNYKTQNTQVFNQQLQNLIDSKGANNITEDDLININNNMLAGRYGNYAYGAKWGLGYLPGAASATGQQLTAMDQNQRQFAVEGADVAAERQAELQRVQQLDARRRVMEALSAPIQSSPYFNNAGLAHGIFGHQNYGLGNYVTKGSGGNYYQEQDRSGLAGILDRLKGIK